MTKSVFSKISNVAAILFIVAEATLFYLIHLAKAPSPISLRYLSIQIAVMFAWLFIVLNAAKDDDGFAKAISNPKNGILIGASMLCTLGADYFLVAIPEIRRMEGMIFFLGTQLFLCLHIIVADNNKRSRLIHLAVRAILSLLLVVITLIVLGSGADALAIVSVIYYANLLSSMIFAPKINGGKILCIGLVLFALCDINVGLAVLNDLYDGGFPEGSLLHSLIYSGVDLVWIFYLPSQTIIPLTVFLSNKKRSLENA